MFRNWFLEEAYLQTASLLNIKDGGEMMHGGIAGGDIRLNFVTKLRFRKVSASYISAGHLAW